MKDTPTITCKKCQTEASSRFCPTCGEQLIAQKPRTAEEITHMLELVRKAAKLGASSSVDLAVYLSITLVFSWVTREGKITPVEMILAGAKDTEAKKALIELAKEYQ